MSFTVAPFSNSGDGLVRNNGAGSWSSLQSASTGTVKSDTGTPSQVYCDGTTADKYIDRFITTFDLSGIPAGSTIVSATLSYFVTSKSSGAGGSVGVTSASPASTSALATTDFGSVGSTDFATRIAFSAAAVTAYENFALNAAGLAYLTTKIGSTAGFALRGSFDIDNSAPGSSVWSSWGVSTSENTGTSQDPKLVVTYALARTTSDAWAWSDVAEPFKRRATADAWAWSDTLTVYRRSTAEVVVWNAGANTTLSGAQTLGSTINVASTTDFPSTGTVWVLDGYDQAFATYTGKTGTTFTGCSWTALAGADLAFPDGCGVAAPDAETHFPNIIPLDTTDRPALLITAGQHSGHAGRRAVGVGKISTDGGMTWGAQFTIATATTGIDYFGAHGGVTRMKNGRLLATWYEHNLDYGTPDSIIQYHSYVNYSDDNGLTWSTPSLLDLNFGYSNRDGAPCTITPGMLYTGAGSNSTYGDYYVLVSGSKDGIFVHSSGQTYRYETWLYKITDGGVGGTATKVAEVFKYSDIGLASGEGDLVIAENGDWIAHSRVEPDSATGTDSDRDRWQSRSTDNGVTWSTPVLAIHALANGAVLTKLPGGTLLATGSPVWTGVDSAGNYGQTASVLSYDNGVTWVRSLKMEATNSSYPIYNGADLAVVINDASVKVNTVMVYAQENSTQTGARTMFRWYVDPVKRTADSWAWSDTASRTLALSRTGYISLAAIYSDDWRWSDAPPPSYTRATSDTWAWHETALAGSGATYTRTTSDTWAWSDAATQSSSGHLTFARTTADAWAWSDALTRALAHPRTTSDLWRWSEPASTATPLFWLKARRRTMSAPVKTYVQVLPKGTTRTTSYTSPTYKAETEAGILVVLDVTAASGTGGLTLRINAHDLAGSVAVPLNAAPTAVTAIGTTSYSLYPFSAVAGNVTQATSFYLPRSFSITVTHGDSSSYTYSVGYCLLP